MMDLLGSPIVVLQVRGTSLAQNPIKGAKGKNLARDNYGPDLAQRWAVFITFYYVTDKWGTGL